jgi:hypothetical protein
MRVVEKLDWKGLKVKKSVGNRKIVMSSRSDIGSERVNKEKVTVWCIKLVRDVELYHGA